MLTAIDENNKIINLLELDRKELTGPPTERPVLGAPTLRCANIFIPGTPTR